MPASGDMIPCHPFIFPVPQPGSRLRLSKLTVSVHFIQQNDSWSTRIFSSRKRSIKCSQSLRFLAARPPDVLRGTSSLCSYVPRPGIEPRIRRPKRRVISVSPSGLKRHLVSFARTFHLAKCFRAYLHTTTKRAETRAIMLRFSHGIPYPKRSLQSLRRITEGWIRGVPCWGVRPRPHNR